MTSVNIPSSVITIGDKAFYGCSTLASVIVIPNSVTAIEDYVFYGCSSLTSMDIPNSVKNIGDYAFRSCSGLTSVTIPSSVKSIGEDAFYNCNALAYIYCQATVPPVTYGYSFSSTVLEDCILYIPTGSFADYVGVTPWSNFKIIGEMDFAGIDTATTEANDDMRLAVENGTITVSGLSEQEHIRVYDAQGRMIYSGTERAITNLPHGLYIVKAGSSTAKAAI